MSAGARKNQNASKGIAESACTTPTAAALASALGLAREHCLEDRCLQDIPLILRKVSYRSSARGGAATGRVDGTKLPGHATVESPASRRGGMIVATPRLARAFVVQAHPLREGVGDLVYVEPAAGYEGLCKAYGQLGGAGEGARTVPFRQEVSHPATVQVLVK